MNKKIALTLALLLALSLGLSFASPPAAEADLAPVGVDLTAPSDGSSLTAADFFTDRGPNFDGGDSAALTAADFPINGPPGEESNPATLDPAGSTPSGEPLTIPASQATCERTIKADVVALDQPFYYNRLGALNANGMMYALKRDVVAKDPNLSIGPGNVMLRPDKRPRPIVLRVNEGDCLEISFTNWLTQDPPGFKFPLPADFPTEPIPGTNTDGNIANPQIDNQPFTRAASIKIDGMFLVGDISSDGSDVGANGAAGNGLAAPGQTKTYKYFAHPDYLGAHLMYSMGSTVGAEGAGGTRAFGLFGAVNEQPRGSLWYRSQLTRLEMDMAASTGDDNIPDWDSTAGYWAVNTTTDNDAATTTDGQPILNYNAVYPDPTVLPLPPEMKVLLAGKAGLPIINMLDGFNLVHTDLNAIISGSNADGSWSDGTWPDNKDLPDRNRAFREFTVIFHDETFAVQAFPSFYNDQKLSHTLHGVVDGFPINYGSGGIGSEIIANRLGVGPMWDCTECKYEEFFLTSFTVGDPAMIVDIPANFGVDQGWVGPKASAVAYPDDPSNVHHSYLNDRIIFRNLHAGPKEHHIFHLHAHQWFFNENEPGSNYHDSQAVGPGSAYTYEIAYGGSGNRNKTVGDSIFHCHFYPHFAQGMWELWRTHDVLERGTEVAAINDGNQGVDTLFFQPTPGARALPDGEIAAGTPIPGVVPMPGYAMAPMPDPAAQVVDGETVMVDDGNGNLIPLAGSSQFDANGDGTADIDQVHLTPEEFGQDSNPGYPFYIPGQVGHRPPTPALDLADVDGDGVIDDGGLPRHVVTSGPADFDGSVTQYQTRLDFNKIVNKATAVELPEPGTAAEIKAMEFHEERWHPTYDTAGNPAQFETNGLPRQPGAPFADPCRSDTGGAIPVNKTYKAANIQMDVTLNKVGWHFPQQRFETLWEDVGPTLAGTRAPEPLVMRLNSKDCAEFWHTNLVPNVYELDDYQVRTPTDIIGQHIHLVKFDVIAADGSANGWNYEDGTLSPDEVQERIHAFNEGGFTNLERNLETLHAQPHPFFKLSGRDANNNGEDDWLGARTTIQRWYADNLLERSWDGGLGAVFTHDHYGPSTHQQVGLYSTVLIEPFDSTWRDPETGECLGNPDGTAQANKCQNVARHDGGPTSWRADILTAEVDRSHREFFMEFADFQHAYEAGGGQWNGNFVDPDSGATIGSYADFDNAINPSFKQQPPQNRLADLYWFPNNCPGNVGRPCPEAISADDPGTYVVNYRNEPIALRVFDPKTRTQADGTPGDLAFAFSSQVNRKVGALNNPPDWTGANAGDPFTPLLRVYQGDKVRVRVQVGAHEEEHTVTFHGLKWKQEPFTISSGWRNSQFAGISEYFNLDIPISPGQQGGQNVDYFYTMGAATDDLWNGIWGIMRAYKGKRNDLLTLPNNDIKGPGARVSNANDFIELCPKSADLVPFDITVVAARDVLPDGTLVYNSRNTSLDNGQSGPLHDPTAMMYVLSEDLTYDPVTGLPNGLKPGTPVEPLVLRANAGACLEVTLRNGLPADYTDMPGFNALPPILAKDKNVVNNGVPGIVTFNANDIQPSLAVGITPQLLSYDMSKGDGANIGTNGTGVVTLGATPKTYRWYAGDITLVKSAQKNFDYDLVATPVEYGAINLKPADMIKGSNKGLVGALVIEPQESCWDTDPGTQASASIWKGAGLSGECATPAPAATSASYREFVTVVQNDINLRYSSCGEVSSIGCAVANIAGEGPGTPEDSQDTGQKAINYGTEPLWYRLGVGPNTAFNNIGNLETQDVFSNDRAGVGGDPETSVFVTSPNGPNGKGGVRVRLLQAGGHARGSVYTLHGHAWQRQPYVNDGTEIGENPRSWWIGVQEGLNPSSHWDLLLNPGGPFNVRGDYLYRDQGSFGSLQGLWGLFRYNTSPPLAADADIFSTTENTPLLITHADLLSNDLDLDDNDPMSITAVISPANGTVFNDDLAQTVTYTPALNFIGTDIFTYIVADGEGTATGTVYITVTPVNDPPLAQNDNAATDEDTAVDVNVLADNGFGPDTDPDGDPLMVTLVDTTGTTGTVTIVSTDTVTYDPNGQFDYLAQGVPANDSFGYTVADGNGAVATATVAIAITGVNDLPLAQDDTVATPQDSAVTVDVLADNGNGPDTDPDVGDTLAVAAVGTPTAGGTAANNLDGTVTYTPTLGFAGTDTFTYTVSDTSGGTATATVSVNVAGAGNNPPAADPQQVTTGEDAAMAITLTGSDADGDTLAFTILTGPANGSLGAVTPTGSATATVTYSPIQNFNGSDSFTFQVDDGKGGLSSAEVTIVVTPANDPPVAQDDNASTILAMAVPISVLADNGNGPDTDPDVGDTLTVTAVGTPANGIATITDQITVRYEPNSVFVGTDSFTYTIEDGNGGTATATVTVTVNPADTVKIGLAEYNKNNGRWKISGTGTNGSSVDLTLLSNPATTIATNLAVADGSWQFNNAGPQPVLAGDSVVATSSGGATHTLAVKIKGN